MKHTTFHKAFKLNNNSFDAIDDLLAYALYFSPEIHHFLEDWFSEKEFVVVKTSGSTGAPKLIQLQKKPIFPIPLSKIFWFFKMFMKKGYCHIDGKVCTINFCGGSERVCGTFADW